MTRLIFALLLTTVVACGGQKTRRAEAPGVVPTSTVTVTGPVSPTWVEGEMPELYDAATHLMVVGRGATVEEAEADAKAKMRAEVLGPDADRPFVTVPDALQAFAYSPGTERYINPEGAAFVRLIAQRVFVIDRLKAWEALMGVGALPDGQPDAFVAGGQPVRDPSTHLEALAATLGHQRASAFVCQRRMAVTTSTCTPTSLAPIRGAMKAFGRAIQLKPRYADGVPFRSGRGAQAPVTVDAVWTSPQADTFPVAGLPLVFKTADEAMIETNDRGRAEWTAGSVTPSDKVSVRINGEGVLGPDAALWASLPAIEVGFRPLDVKTARVAYLIDEGNNTSGRNEMKKKLMALGMVEPQALPDSLKAFFAQGAPDAAKRKAFIDAADGQFDVVAVGEMHSQFASRFGARAVWHEAQGELTVFDIWSGAQIGPLTGTVRASAIGERAASSKALAALGKQLADKVAKMLTEHYRADAAAQR